jgi:hypothetical protein
MLTWPFLDYEVVQINKDTMLEEVILRRLLSRQELSRKVLTLKYNGPAVEGVNVGGAVRQYESWYFRQTIVLAGKPPWRNFCKSRRKIKLSR